MSVSLLQMANYTYLYICCRFTEKIKQKRKSKRVSLIRLPFAHLANRSLSFVCLLAKKQMAVYKQTKWTKTDLPIYARLEVHSSIISLLP
jgi:hypothetical protein